LLGLYVCENILQYLSFSVALQSLKVTWSLHTLGVPQSYLGTWLECIVQTISLSGRPLLHRTQHRKTRTNILALKGVQSHVQAIKTYALDLAATGTGRIGLLFISVSSQLNLLSEYCKRAVYNTLPLNSYAFKSLRQFTFKER
jgi:hypothetical protein